MAISPDKRVLNPTDNYINILGRIRDAFRDIEIVADMLSEIALHRTRYKDANLICEQFTIYHLEPIFKKIFKINETPQGISDYSTIFDPSEMTGGQITLASYMLKFSSEYLLQAFPGGQFEYLNKRVNDLVTELESMETMFDQTKRLTDDLKKYKEYIMTPNQRYVEPHEKMFLAECTFCKDTAYGWNEDKARESVKHYPKCKYLDLKENDSKEVKYTWFRVLSPTNLEVK